MTRGSYLRRSQASPVELDGASPDAVTLAMEEGPGEMDAAVVVRDDSSSLTMSASAWEEGVKVCNGIQTW